ALAHQTVPKASFEVVVVDDGSEDGTIDAVQRVAQSMSYTLRLVEQPHLGPAEARNAGVAAASGRLIIFLDDDVIPDARLLEEHVGAHADATDLVVVGPMSPPAADARRPAWI